MRSLSCARPACPGKPVARLAYDYEARCAWLDDQPEGPAGGEHSWPLCERHANSLKVPRGWFSVDRRQVTGREGLAAGAAHEEPALGAGPPTGRGDLSQGRSSARAHDPAGDALGGASPGGRDEGRRARGRASGIL